MLQDSSKPKTEPELLEVSSKYYNFQDVLKRMENDKHITIQDFRSNQHYYSASFEVTRIRILLSWPNWGFARFFNPLTVQILSWKPRAVYYPGFANAEQCQSIIEMAKITLEPSTLALRKGETEETTKGTRTSSGTFISASEDKSGTLDIIEEKIARATMIPKTHGEEFNVLRYEIGQRYLSHYDAFNPDEYGPQKSQRVASFLLYLSDVEEGGETIFPFENGLNMDINYNFKECIGLKVKPRQGDGLLFYSLFPNGTIDQMSLHGSCPVIKGEKWVATKWIRNQEDYY
ncbi:hypothetical protein GIB67_030432 [Kingdonia uniflora]|uniref:procollagen-proline 4-dioxygenase n=1 Tax=Kingdonia uniflora TaxID=39325 RepID=A0A7J7NE20_9MAGN|nr:hypothetical protein GIB67_030432 [Kingdonia uniflora]